MAYRQCDPPNNAALNSSLVAAVQKLSFRAETLLQKAAKVETMSQCDHDWKHWVDVSSDGHRTDRSDEYTCTKCGYTTAYSVLDD